MGNSCTSLWHQASGAKVRASENERTVLENGIVCELGSNYAGTISVYGQSEDSSSKAGPLRCIAIDLRRR